MNLEELDEAEDDLDERVFAEYRRKRIEEMRALQKAATYGDVLEITGREWVREVNQAGQDVSVVVHLYKQGYNKNGKIKKITGEFRRVKEHLKGGILLICSDFFLSAKMSI